MQECLAAMSYHGIDNIRVIVDVNRQQCDGAMSSVLDLGDLAARVAAFGVTCRSVDGHDLDALARGDGQRRGRKAARHPRQYLALSGHGFPQEALPAPALCPLQSAEEMQAALAAELGIDLTAMEGA